MKGGAMTTPMARDEMAATLRQDTPRFTQVADIHPAVAEHYLDQCMAEQDQNLREPGAGLTFDRTTEARAATAGLPSMMDRLMCSWGQDICAPTPRCTARTAR